MGEMISSFDGTRLFLNREVPEAARGAASSSTGYVNIREDMITLLSCFTKPGSQPTVSITGVTDVLRGNGPTMKTLMNCLMTQMLWWTWQSWSIRISRFF